MRKEIILVLSLLAIVVFFEIMSLIKLQQNNEIQEDKKYIRTYTKAICNKNNYCQDNIIECEDNKVIKIAPITGSTVQFSDDWKDPRDEETINKLC